MKRSSPHYYPKIHCRHFDSIRKIREQLTMVVMWVWMRMCHRAHMCLHPRLSVITKNHNKSVSNSFLFANIALLLIAVLSDFILSMEPDKAKMLPQNALIRNQSLNWWLSTYRVKCAYCVLLCLPVVPCRSYQHFFVEAYIIHFHCTNEHRFVLFDYDILQWYILII